MKTYPSNVQIEVTEGCNHSCFYCYNHFREDNPMKNRMNQTTATKIMDIVLNEIKPFEVTITGGEPFLNFPITKEIAKRLWENKAPCSINSNMVYATTKNLEKIKQVHEEFSILASLPSHRKTLFYQIVGADNFEKVYENMRQARNMGIRITPNMVIHQLNYRDIYAEGSKLVDELGIDSFCATPVLKPSFREDSGIVLKQEETNEAFRELLRLQEDKKIKVNVLEVVPYCSLPEDLRGNNIFRRGCGAGRNTLQIGYSGEVRSCGHSPFVVGNILKDGFEKVWSELKPFRENQYVPKDCEDCAEVNYCRGGCRYENLQEGDSLDKKDSRMTSPLDKSSKPKSQEIDDDTSYKVNIYASRQDAPNQVTLYNGKTMVVNNNLRDFIYSVKERGTFRVNDYPEEIKKKARGLGKILLNGDFLLKK